jgi:RNA polymerase sigma factor (sigma-70 family)
VSSGPHRTRLLIVEDHPLLAEGLVAVLGREATFEIVGSARTAADAIRQVAATWPDLVLMDQHLPDGKGTDVAKAIRQEPVRTAVVMLTGDTSDETLLAAVEAGVSGFIPKREPIDRVVDLLKRSSRGEIVIPPTDLARLLNRQRQREIERRDAQQLIERLTRRDREVLALMAQGMDNAAIAERMTIAPNTVRGYVQNIIEKLETHSRLEAVLRATALALVPPAEPPS